MTWIGSRGDGCLRRKGHIACRVRFGGAFSFAMPHCTGGSLLLFVDVVLPERANGGRHVGRLKSPSR